MNGKYVWISGFIGAMHNLSCIIAVCFDCEVLNLFMTPKLTPKRNC